MQGSRSAACKTLRFWNPNIFGDSSAVCECLTPEGQDEGATYDIENQHC